MRVIVKLLIVTLLAISFQGCERNDTKLRGFDRERMTYYQNSIKFDYDRIIPEPKNPVLDFMISILRAMAWLFKSVFGIAILLLLLAGVIWILIKMNNSSLRESNVRQEELRILNDPEAIETDFAALLQKALTNKDYRLAVRYLYLNTLKTFSLRNLIRLQDGKTNREYFHELPAELKPAFGKMLNIFEYVWYGEFPSSEYTWKTVQAMAQDLDELSKKHRRDV